MRKRRLSKRSKKSWFFSYFWATSLCVVFWLTWCGIVYTLYTIAYTISIHIRVYYTYMCTDNWITFNYNFASRARLHFIHRHTSTATLMQLSHSHIQQHSKMKSLFSGFVAVRFSLYEKILTIFVKSIETSNYQRKGFP